MSTSCFPYFNRNLTERPPRFEPVFPSREIPHPAVRRMRAIGMPQPQTGLFSATTAVAIAGRQPAGLSACLRTKITNYPQPSDAPVRKKSPLQPASVPEHRKKRAEASNLEKKSYLCTLCLTNCNYDNAKNENKCRCKEAFYFHRHR